MYLADAQSQIEAFVNQNEPFGSIEDFVNSFDEFTDEEKSALWLYAWSLQPPRAQRRVAREALAHAVSRHAYVS